MVLARPATERPRLEQLAAAPAASVVKAVHPKLGERYLYCEGAAPLLFTENETNTQRIFGVPNRSPYVKDSINNYIVHGQEDGREPGAEGDQGRGTLSGDRRSRPVPGGAAAALRPCARPTLSEVTVTAASPFGNHFDERVAGAAAGGR